MYSEKESEGGEGQGVAADGRDEGAGEGQAAATLAARPREGPLPAPNAPNTTRVALNRPSRIRVDLRQQAPPTTSCAQETRETCPHEKREGDVDVTTAA